MKSSNMMTGLVCVALLAAGFVITPPESHADPILKPKKYHGPIPRRSFGLSIGFLAGPNNEQMYGYLQQLVEQPLQSSLTTDDFGAAPAVDAYYTVKLHPQFALRVTGGFAYLQSSSSGLAVASEPDTNGLTPLLQFDRTFDVWLFSVQGSGLYYFQDSAVSEFQAYIGGGFSFFFPVASWTENTQMADTGAPYTNSETNKSTIEPGLQGVLGALYHVRNNVAFFLEGRYQISQSKFKLDLPTATAGNQNLSFDVNYSGFVLAVGASRFF